MYFFPVFNVIINSTDAIPAVTLDCLINFLVLTWLEPVKKALADSIV